MSITSKRLAGVSWADLEAYLAEEPPESDTLELKRTLPSNGPDSDPWLRGENRIGDKARNELLEEVVAFANAHGGLLLVGVEESRDHPKRAAGVIPLPRCAELADRFRLQARDCIEPPLAGIEAVGIARDGEGQGVLAIRVAASIRAPHRLNAKGAPRECYVRRADRSEKLTMREIHELTLYRANAATAATERLAKSSATFRAEHYRTGADAYAMRATGVPLGEISVAKVYQNDAVRPVVGRFNGLVGAQPVALHLPREPHQERPILRGSAFTSEQTGLQLCAEVRSDGAVEFVWRVDTEFLTRSNTLHPEWVMGTAMNLLLTCDRFRRAAGAPGQEYAVEFEIMRSHPVPMSEGIRLNRWNNTYMTFDPGAIEANPILFPQFSLGAPEEITTLLMLLHRDLFNAAGIDVSTSELSVEVPVSD